MKKYIITSLLTVILPVMLYAHEIRPAYLEITELPNNHLHVIWKQPIMGEMGLSLHPKVSGGWLSDSTASIMYTESYLLKEWNINSSVSLDGQTITINGLNKTMTDVLLRINFKDGSNTTQLIKPIDPVYQIRTKHSNNYPTLLYLRLGIEHILSGADHLLFVLGLVLLVGYGRKLLATVTSFTIAHSITLAAATLGLVHLQQAFVEAAISLSIVFLAVELVKHHLGQDGFTYKYPWIVAFCFGLLHGLGFAGALADIGLPQKAVPLALFLFNIGVEIGQLLFVICILTLIRLVKRWRILQYPGSKWISPYAIGSVAAYWFIERLSYMFFTSFTLLICLSSCNNAETKTTDTDSTNTITKAETALPDPNPSKNCYFGDLHLHTSYSMDAYLMTTRTTPEDAYRYAMGETVKYLGNDMKRNAPYDFLAVTDHAEYIGVMSLIPDPNGKFRNTDWYRRFTTKDRKSMDSTYLMLVGSLFANKPFPEFMNTDVIRSNWQNIIQAADKYNEPGKFTTFVAYEWTSAPVYDKVRPQNLHRCVIFKGNKVPALPFSAFDSPDPEQLWTYLENARKTGDDVIAIPHNGNASNGLMFDTKTLSGRPLTKEYAIRRMANEPLTEINQGKGQSETHPLLSPTDEFANFELWETLVGYPAKAKFQKGSYVRQAYGVGQEEQEKIGVNPFKYGLEGGTDYHSGISSTEENNYWGSHGNTDPLHTDPALVLEDTAVYSAGGQPVVTLGAAGITGIWAEQNTREALFDALKRKECFGTSGNRIKVRFFAGWNYPANLVKHDDWVKQAYAGGIPMGSDLPPGKGKPKFIVEALKDPNMGNLDRIQIIKVSTKKGKSKEKVVDVVWSGNRNPDAKTGKLPQVGNTVDLKTATYTNTIGETELVGFWEDVDFDPEAYITYYARVLEIPTPRWSTIQSVRNNMPLNRRVPPVIQERAWTSPIWYTPAK